MNIWFIVALAVLIIVVICLIIFILVKKQKFTTTTETYKSSSPQMNKNINSLMNYINQWISSIKSKQ